MRILWELFSTFFKIGIVTFGGGLAMIPLIEEEIVERKAWVEQEDILNIFAVAQTIPGAIAINTATMVGYKLKGKRGAVAATFGVVLPSFIIILLIATFTHNIDAYPVVGAAFEGISGGVVALISLAVIKMIIRIDKTIKTFFIIFVSSMSILLFDLNPIVVIMIFIFFGIVDYIVTHKNMKEDVDND
ncbi:MAG: chromate transporter [Clostridiales bacterium]|nr:MAG: chromate transporter [Clostridiales bacterium]